MFVLSFRLGSGGELGFGVERCLQLQIAAANSDSDCYDRIDSIAVTEKSRRWQDQDVQVSESRIHTPNSSRTVRRKNDVLAAESALESARMKAYYTERLQCAGHG